MLIAAFLGQVAGICAFGAVVFWLADGWLPDPPQPPQRKRPPKAKGGP